ncbi:MAG TPA: DUF5679 domain-containing protein, partial [Ktedonobacteraceae bacterium]|nr:DUF5679 domain-containing protein [Ktedonobacteraceae bacterium]
EFEVTVATGRKTSKTTGKDVVTEERPAPAQAQEANEIDTQTAVESTDIEVYCARCKKKTIMQNVREVTTKNGKPALKGTCSVCGAAQYRAGRI